MPTPRSRLSKSGLNVAYGQHSDAPALVVLIRKDHDIAVHNATASLKSAEYNRDQLKQQLDRITAGEFAQYGITEPSEDESAQLATRQQTVDDAQATLVRVRESAGDPSVTLPSQTSSAYGRASRLAPT